MMPPPRVVHNASLDERRRWTLGNSPSQTQKFAPPASQRGVSSSALPAGGLTTISPRTVMNGVPGRTSSTSPRNPSAAATQNHRHTALEPAQQKRPVAFTKFPSQSSSSTSRPASVQVTANAASNWTNAGGHSMQLPIGLGMSQLPSPPQPSSPAQITRSTQQRTGSPNPSPAAPPPTSARNAVTPSTSSAAWTRTESGRRVPSPSSSFKGGPLVPQSIFGTNLRSSLGGYSVQQLAPQPPPSWTQQAQGTVAQAAPASQTQSTQAAPSTQTPTQQPLSLSSKARVMPSVVTQAASNGAKPLSGSTKSVTEAARPQQQQQQQPTPRQFDSMTFSPREPPKVATSGPPKTRSSWPGRRDAHAPLLGQTQRLPAHQVQQGGLQGQHSMQQQQQQQQQSAAQKSHQQQPSLTRSSTQHSNRNLLPHKENLQSLAQTKGVCEDQKPGQFPSEPLVATARRAFTPQPQLYAAAQQETPAASDCRPDSDSLRAELQTGALSSPGVPANSPAATPPFESMTATPPTPRDKADMPRVLDAITFPDRRHLISRMPRYAESAPGSRASSTEHRVHHDERATGSSALPRAASAESRSLRVTTGACGLKGHKHGRPDWQNQDTHLSVWLTNELLLLGVFDGHGELGHESAAKTRDIFKQYAPHYLVPQRRNSQHSLVQQFTQLFAFTQKLVETEGLADLSGTTVVVALVDAGAGVVTIAHAGDSRLILVRNGMVEFETIDHVIDDKEVLRIEAVGGEVCDLDGSYEGLRRVFVRGQRYPGLAMARSIGDKEAHEVGVLDEPVVNGPFSVLSGDVLVLATDGVWDRLSSDQVAMQLEGVAEPEGGAYGLAHTARSRWPMDGDVDDVTVLLAQVVMPYSGRRYIPNLPHSLRGL